MAYLCERLSFRQLLAYSEEKRKARSKNVRGPALKLDTGADSNYYHFNFRSYPSTTGHRHVGYVRFLKPKNPDKPVDQCDCEADCSCPDYKFRFAWSNKQRGAGTVGTGSYNKAWNRAPRITNPLNRPGLCKHLIAVRDYIHGLLYMQPAKLKAPEKINRVMVLANKAVINPDKEELRNKRLAQRNGGQRNGRTPAQEPVPDGQGDDEPFITAPAPFRASPAQQSSGRGPTRGRVEPRVSAVDASKRAERERRQSINRVRRGAPKIEMVVSHMKGNKLFEEAAEALAGEEQALSNRPDSPDTPPVDDVDERPELPEAPADELDGGETASVELLKEIRDLLRQVLTVDSQGAEGDGFELPDGATQIDLGDGEEKEEEDEKGEEGEEGEDELPDAKLFGKDRLDPEADADEEAEGGPDDEDEEE